MALQKINGERKSRGYCGTLNFNNDVENDQVAVKIIVEQIFKNLVCTFYRYQTEIAPTTGKLHLQWFVYFKSPHSFNSVKNIFPYGTHIEHIKGSPKMNKEYCEKMDTRAPGNRFLDGTFGECPMQGMIPIRSDGIIWVYGGDPEYVYGYGYID